MDKNQGTTVRKIKNRFEVIKNEISQLVQDKYYFETYKKYIEKSRDIDKKQDFLFFISKNYQILSLINVCKQVDKRADVESLIKLLKEIRENKRIFTIEWYKSQWKPVPIGGTNKKIYRSKEAEKYFKDFSIKNNQFISYQKMSKDIQKIKNAIEGLRFGKKRQSIRSLLKYRHKRGAHFANKKSKINVPVADLYKAIDLLERKILKYDILINQREMNTLLPSNIDSFLELEKIFKE